MSQDAKSLPRTNSATKPRNNFPTTASEAYSLAVSAKEAVFQTCVLLIEDYNDTKIVKGLKHIANQEKKELRVFSSWLNYELNCACSAFYESNGAIIMPVMSEEAIDGLAPKVNQTLDEFYAQIDRIQRFIVAFGRDELGCHRGINDERGAFRVVFDTRLVCKILFENLAALYPEGEIRNAFLNMADIIYQNDLIAGKEYAKYL